MNLEERCAALKKVACILGSVEDASMVFSVESEVLHLRVKAGSKKWSISAAAEPFSAGRDMCVNYLLRKMSHAASVCPKCQSHVNRLANDPKTNKTPVKRYRCAGCMHSWTDS